MGATIQSYRRPARPTAFLALLLAFPPAALPQGGRAPDPPPAAWQFLIGEYGRDTITRVMILERDGRLVARIASEGEELLQPAGGAGGREFRSPTRRFHFEPDSGPPARLRAGDSVWVRRPLGGAETVFRITPQRPVDLLRQEALAARPPRESGEFRPADLVELVALDSSIRLDIRYATGRNFLGTPVYTQARAFLQRPAALALVRAHQELLPLGYGLLIHDGYRPWYVTRIFWDATPPSLREFVADPAAGSRHNRGAAVDLSLYDRTTGRPVEMPGGYDEFSHRSYPDYPGGTSRQRWHRDLLRRVMEAEGFVVFPAEWWHFDYRDWRSYRIGNEPFERLGSPAPR